MLIIPSFIAKFILKSYLYLRYTAHGENIPEGWKLELSEKRIIDPLRKF
jgi:hypothetical protein